ncbi:MAG: DUF1294 domain-containing protein [Lachnospiraceae bacterium]|jgi:uncharacterized membrane protein YsdA (DUF1294 family)|nr:DUF1294 domain-containing protein [Lachnospiraceae bacterium]
MTAEITLLIALVTPNLLGFALMGIDKQNARQSAFRVPEAILFCLALIGGSIGCIAGMRVFHHKTRKPAFFIGMPLILVLQLAAVILLWRSPLRFRFL